MFLLLTLLSLQTNMEVFLGSPSEISYIIPPGYQFENIESDSGFVVIAADYSKFVIVPLLFADTLPLPQIIAIGEEDTLIIDPPIITVLGNLPDSLMTPSLPQLPSHMTIPPGIPENYTRNVSFWLVWGTPPLFPWLWVIGSILVISAIVIYLIRRKRSKASENLVEDFIDSLPAGKIAEKEALALLESENFIHGRWVKLYTEIDRQYRATVAKKFGIINKAFTLNQIRRTLVSNGTGRKFLEQASPITKEIILQRYADFGSSKERATGFIKKLAKLRGEWSR